MSEPLDQYLTQSYRREVLGEQVKVDMPTVDDEAADKLIAEIEAGIAKIDALHLGAHLASRDFAAYQNRRAMLRLLLQLKSERIRRRLEREDKDAASGTGPLQGERADIDARDRQVTARPES
jgi:hypothetical protein